MVRCSYVGCWNGLPCSDHGDVELIVLNSEQMLHPDALSDDTITKLLTQKNVRARIISFCCPPSHTTAAAAASTALKIPRRETFHAPTS